MIIKTQKGFTLIEVVTVISIIALLAAIAIPYLAKFQPNLKLTAAGRMLTADLRLAQQLTVTEQTVHLISLNISGGSYSLLSLGTATTTVKSVLLPADVFFDSASTTVAEIRFNSYGGASSESDGLIYMKNANEKTLIIGIKPSGYVELKD
jgi:prepilin-type N-terminal cleavage/methylation domain-containing protein